MIPAHAVNAGMHDRPIPPNTHIRHAGAEVDHNRSPLFPLLRQHRQAGGIAGEGAALHPDLLVRHALHAGLQPGALAGDEVVVGLDLFGVGAQRVGRSHTPVERIATQQLMQDGVIPRQRQMGGQLVKFIQRTFGDTVFVICGGGHADRFVARGQMGAAHRQIHLGNLRLGAAFGIGQGHPGGGAGVSEVGHLCLPHAGGNGLAHAQKREGSVPGHLRDGHGHLLRAEIGRDEDFV